MTATPRPWSRSGVRSRTEAGWPFISIGHGDDPHSLLVLYGRTNEENISAEQDARLILKAVNCHDELVEALRFYADERRYDYDETCCPTKRNPGRDEASADVLGDDGERARAVLTKVTAA